ncbi:MAG: hypothetical protein A2W90_09345 [Bacteroidetes bacterium GWF2_42_66]|nr:MAG: hypothetical protein A2W92_00035 [Bacteroidetes bacterium GWA2_42_15]OFY01963.1 MAG: hypothetical protein A2W89_22550 [Bacteroidetes bacterium GWE2_42_39]OFY46493.1 MAG: hypothetical protein A2W90_09345 [Bacteroidetes bacterium GWF2_42_66]
MNSTRRNFIKTGFVVVAGITVSPDIMALTPQVSTCPTICIFSKCLQFLDYQQLAEIIAKLGFDGVDLPVRKDGQVIPENVKDELPKVSKELQKVGKVISMIATDIVDANDPITEDILETASSLGIRYYRMGRLTYDHSLSINQNLDKHKRTIQSLESLNRKYQIHGCIQNHSGPYNMVGAPVWDLHYLLKDSDPEYIGVQYDIMHATAEGVYSWPLGLELVSPWIKTIDIKDFIWEKDKSEKWNTKIIPLGEGMVNYRKFIKEIKRLNIHAAYSVHCEYDLGGAENGSLHPEMEADEIYKKIKRDLSFFKTLDQS